MYLDSYGHALHCFFQSCHIEFPTHIRQSNDNSAASVVFADQLLSFYIDFCSRKIARLSTLLKDLRLANDDQELSMKEDIESTLDAHRKQSDLWKLLYYINSSNQPHFTKKVLDPLQQSDAQIVAALINNHTLPDACDHLHIMYLFKHWLEEQFEEVPPIIVDEETLYIHLFILLKQGKMARALSVTKLRSRDDLAVALENSLFCHNSCIAAPSEEKNYNLRSSQFVDIFGRFSRTEHLSTCFRSANCSTLSSAERAIYAFLCGDLKNLLPLCPKHGDQLWARFHCSIINYLDELLCHYRNMPMDKHSVPAEISPDFFDTTANQSLFDKIYTLFMKYEKPSFLLTEMESLLLSPGSADDSYAIDFFCHFAIVCRVRGDCDDDVVFSRIISRYLKKNMLFFPDIDQQYFQQPFFYISFLPQENDRLDAFVSLLSDRFFNGSSVSKDTLKCVLHSCLAYKITSLRRFLSAFSEKATLHILDKLNHRVDDYRSIFELARLVLQLFAVALLNENEDLTAIRMDALGVFNVYLIWALHLEDFSLSFSLFEIFPDDFILLRDLLLDDISIYVVDYVHLKGYILSQWIFQEIQHVMEYDSLQMTNSRVNESSESELYDYEAVKKLSGSKLQSIVPEAIYRLKSVLKCSFFWMGEGLKIPRKWVVPSYLADREMLRRRVIPKVLIQLATLLFHTKGLYEGHLEHLIQLSVLVANEDLKIYEVFEKTLELNTFLSFVEAAKIELERLAVNHQR